MTNYWCSKFANISMLFVVTCLIVGFVTLGVYYALVDLIDFNGKYLEYIGVWIILGGWFYNLFVIICSFFYSTIRAKFRA